MYHRSYSNDQRSTVSNVSSALASSTRLSSTSYARLEISSCAGESEFYKEYQLDPVRLLQMQKEYSLSFCDYHEHEINSSYLTGNHANSNEELHAAIVNSARSTPQRLREALGTAQHSSSTNTSACNSGTYSTIHSIVTNFSFGSRDLMIEPDEISSFGSRDLMIEPDEISMMMEKVTFLAKFVQHRKLWLAIPAIILLLAMIITVIVVYLTTPTTTTTTTICNVQNSLLLPSLNISSVSVSFSTTTQSVSIALSSSAPSTNATSSTAPPPTATSSTAPPPTATSSTASPPTATSTTAPSTIATSSTAPSTTVTSSNEPPPPVTSSEYPNCCPDGWHLLPASISTASRCIRVFPHRTTWHAADDVCIALNGRLASVHSEFENQFIFNEIRRVVQDGGDIYGINDGVWLGGKMLNPLFVNVTSAWFWVDGTNSSSYTNWARGHPNIGLSLETCIGMYTQASLATYWNGYHPTYTLSFVCLHAISGSNCNRLV